MDHLTLFIGGILIGVLVAAPIGPVNLICVRRTLAYGPINGFFSGFGGAAGDGVFAVITAFGLTAVSLLVQGYAAPLKLVGGLMLIAFGIHNFRAEVTDPRSGCPVDLKEKGTSTLWGAIVSTFALTITNPATLLGFAALFAGLGTIVGGEATYMAATVTVAGVVTGSILWWLAITSITGAFHRQVNASVMRQINYISGIAVTGFGILVLIDLLFGIF